MMTRKDYVKIAKAISESKSNSGRDEFVSRPYVIEKLCTIFIEDNPNFDRTRFLTACNEEG